MVVMGLLFFVIACFVAAMVAKRRGRSFWLFLLITLAGGPLWVVIAAQSGATQFVGGLMAFLSPALGLLVALAMDSSATAAQESGAHGDLKKCPFCAEAVRREAIKCKHCGSELPVAG